MLRCHWRVSTSVLASRLDVAFTASEVAKLFRKTAGNDPAQWTAWLPCLTERLFRSKSLMSAMDKN